MREGTNLTSFLWKTYHPIHSPRLYGEQILLADTISGIFDEYEGTIPYDIDGAVIAIRANDNIEYLDQINSYIATLKWCVIIITGNEDSSDFYKGILHSNKKIWLQTPGPSDKADRYFGLGYPTRIKDFDINSSNEREFNWFFAGQVTHPRRAACAEQLKRLNDGKLISTSGFNQGLKYDNYILAMSNSKVIPCPAGPATPDTFRFWEALEAGCVPVADLSDRQDNYWEKIFGGPVPFPTIRNWEDLPRIIESEVNDWPNNAIEISKWWLLQKQKLKSYLVNDVRELMGSST